MKPLSSNGSKYTLPIVFYRAPCMPGGGGAKRDGTKEIIQIAGPC